MIICQCETDMICAHPPLLSRAESLSRLSVRDRNYATGDKLLATKTQTTHDLIIVAQASDTMKDKNAPT